MSWSALQIQPTAANSAGILAGSLSSLAVREVSPWMHGVADIQGHYGHLSFPNAVDALRTSVGSSAQAGFAVAIAASSLASFIAQCQTISAAFPFKVVQQWQRRAEKLKPLEIDKFALPATQGPVEVIGLQSNGLPVVGDLRKAALQQTAKADAVSFDATNPIANLTAFQAEKAASDGEIDQAVADVNAGLTGGAGWRFYASGDLFNALKIGMPGHDKTLTAIALFLGTPEELALLNEIFSA